MSVLYGVSKSGFKNRVLFENIFFSQYENGLVKKSEELFFVPHMKTFFFSVNVPTSHVGTHFFCTNQILI